MQFFKIFVFVALFAVAFVAAAPLDKRQAVRTTTTAQPTATDGSRVAAASPKCDDATVLSDSEPVSSVDGKTCTYNSVPPDQQ
ncbi:15394_t:CDS:1, partial [Racocetra fulgida]